jgi:hypothetical protein
MVSGAGSLVQGADARTAGDYNARLLALQAHTAQNQALADEQTQRRQAREVLGEQAASLAQAGAGYGGTTAGVINQSAVNAELDALNIRYGGTMKASGLLAQAAAERYRGRAGQTSSYFLAGSDLLKGYAAKKAA